MRNAARVRKVGKFLFEQIDVGSVPFDDLVEGVRAENRGSAIENVQHGARRLGTRLGRANRRVWGP